MKFGFGDEELALLKDDSKKPGYGGATGGAAAGGGGGLKHSRTFVEWDKKDKSRLASQKKLTKSTVFVFIFLIVELVGGYLANSLAIMTDAAHLLSDVSSFLVSIFAIRFARGKKTSRMTFGSGRIETLGAVMSVMVIWLLTVWLVYEAILRTIIIVRKLPLEIDGRLMTIIAALGLLVNLILMFILGGHEHGEGEEDHGHSHDIIGLFKQMMGWESGHGHSHGGGGHGHSHGGGDDHGHSHDDDHGHSHDGPDGGHGHSHDDDHGHSHDGPDGGHGHSHDDDHGHSHDGPDGGHGHSHDDDHGHSHDGPDGGHGHSHDDEAERSGRVLGYVKAAFGTLAGAHVAQRAAIGEHVSAQAQALHQSATEACSKGLPAPSAKDFDTAEDIGELNVRAAFVHAIGDLVQSVGVLIAGVIVWIFPQAKLADPVCTLIFAVLVLYTTVGVMRDGVSVLLETVPGRLNHNSLTSSIQSVAGVDEVTDLHVWSLTQGVTMLVAHVRVVPTVATMEAAYDVVNRVRDRLSLKHGIHHATVEIDDDKLVAKMPCIFGFGY